MVQDLDQGGQFVETHLVDDGPTLGWQLKPTGGGGGGGSTTLDWVNVKDFGAIGDGNSHPLSSVYGTLAAAQAFYPAASDLTLEIDYCAIQLAIDFAATHQVNRVIYIPGGSYLTTLPLYLDTPGNLRSTSGFPPWASGTTYASGDQVKYNGVLWKSATSGNIGHVPSMASTFWTWFVGTASSGFGWGATLVGNEGQFDDIAGTRILTNFSNAPYLLVGPLNGCSIKHLTIIGPVVNSETGIGYHGGQHPSGVGIAVCAMSAGSTRTRIENCCVARAYTGFYFGYTLGSLGDSNVLVRCITINVFVGCKIAQTQVYINAFYDCNLAAVHGVESIDPFTVVGGNWSVPSGGGKIKLFTIASVSALSTDGSGDISFTATVTNADADLRTSAIGDGRAGIYTAFVVNTAHYGPVPLTMTAFSGSDVGTFKILTSWRFQSALSVASSDIQAEIQACTTLYSHELATTWAGSVKAYGAYIENPTGVTTIVANNSWQNWDALLSGTVFQYDLTFSYGSPLLSPSPEALTVYLINSTFPTFAAINGGIMIESSLFPNGSGPFFGNERMNIDLTAPSAGQTWRFVVRDFYQFRANLRGGGAGNPFLGLQNAGLWFSDVGRNAIGWGEFDSDPGAIYQTNALSAQVINQAAGGKQQQPTIGIRPAHHTLPMVPADSFVNLKRTPTFVAGGADVPLVWGGMTYRVDQEVAFFNQVSHLFRSNHACYTYGLDIVNPNVGWTVSWSMKGATTILFVDQNTMSMMRTGLVIGLSIAGVTEWFMIVAVIPGNLQLIAFNVGAASDGFTANHGVKTTVYTGSTIFQQPFSLELLTGAAHPSFANAAYQAVMGEEILADTSGAAFTITLPTIRTTGFPILTGQAAKVVIRDSNGTFATNNLTVNRNGQNINSAASNLVLNTNGQTLTLVYINSTIGWKTY